MKNGPRCEALLISCIDFRFETKFQDYLTNQNLVDDNEKGFFVSYDCIEEI
jgi:hypothetical protein